MLTPGSEYPQRIEDTAIEPNPKTGYLEIRWTSRDASGRARTRTHSCRTKDADVAKAVRDAWFAAIWHMSAVSPAKTVGQLIDSYKKLYADLHGLADAQEWALKPVRASFGSSTLADLTALKTADYVLGRRALGRKDGTIRRELGALIAVLNWAVRVRELPEDTTLPHIDLPAQSPAVERYLEADEEERCFLLASQDTEFNDRGADAPRLSRRGRFICIGLEAPMRTRRIELLEWDRVDFKTRRIDFRTPGERATKKRVGVKPISDRLLPVLERAYREKTGPYVLDHTGSVRKGFENFVSQHGFEITKHDLRRTWATLRAQWGVPLWDIAGMLDDDIKTVTKNYAHHCPEHLRGAANARRPTKSKQEENA